MRDLTSFTLAVVFAAGLLLTATKTQAQKPDSSPVKSAGVQSGFAVAAKVEGLKRDNENVRGALHLFEKWGHRPKVEDSHAVTARVELKTAQTTTDNGFAIRKASAQTVRDGSIELIFVPVIDTELEWQGTMIANLYNYANQLVAQEVLNLVMRHEATGRWSPVYELSFVSGQPFVHYQSGMYGGFALGTTIADHPAVTGSAPPTNLLQWQLQQPSPCPFGPEMNLPGCQPGLSPQSYKPVSYRDTFFPILAAPQGNPYIERFPGRCLSTGSYCNNIGGLPGLYGPRVRRTAHDAFPMCVAFGVASAGRLPVFLTGCGAQVAYYAGRHIFLLW